MFFVPPMTRMFNSVPTITYNASSFDWDALDGENVYTFTNVEFGTAHANREVFIVGYSGNDNPPTSVTIGGVTAVVDTVSHPGTSSNPASSFCAHAHIPTGTTGTVVVTWPEDALITIITAFRVINRQTINAPVIRTDEFSGEPTDNGPNSVSASVPKNGFAIFSNLLFFNFAMTWSGNATEVVDASAVTDTARFSVALSPVQTATATLTGTVDWTTDAESRTAMWVYK